MSVKPMFAESGFPAVPPNGAELRELIHSLRGRLSAGALTAESVARTRCRLAQCLEALGQYAEALTALSQVDVASRVEPLTPVTAAAVWFQMGRLHHHLNNVPRAIHCANTALKLFLETGNPGCGGHAHTLLGRIYATIDEYAIARDHLEQAREALEPGDDPRALAECRWHLANIANQEGRVLDSREEAARGLALMERIETPSASDELLFGQLLDHTAILAFEQGDLATAVSNLERAIAHWSKSDDPNVLAVAYDHLADAQISAGQWKEGEASLERALALAAANKQTESMVLRTFAKFRTFQGKMDDAERMARVAIERALETGITSIEAGGWEALAEVMLANGRVEEAISLFEQTVRLNSKINRVARLPVNHLRLAEACLAVEDYNRAEAHLNRARELFGTPPKLHSAGLAARLEGRLRLVREEQAEGIAALTQSISMFEAAGFLYEAACSHLEAGQAFVAMSNGPRALTHLDIAVTSFCRLDALPSLKRAEAVRATARGLIEVAPEPVIAPSLDALLVERLVAAAAAPDLLLRELTILLRDELRLNAVIFEHMPDGIRLLTGEASAAERIRRSLTATIEDSRPLPDGLNVRPFSDSRQTTEVYPTRRFFLCIGGEVTPTLATTVDALLHVVEIALENGRLRNALRSSRTVVSSYHTTSNLAAIGLVCESPAMLKVAEKINKIRTSDVTVLITGESGVGKELVARALHATSRRHTRAFLPFNCAAIPAELVESRLFGHRQGAFTGANKSAPGIIRSAAGGTLFLDEIGEIALHVQPKLLRFLQEHEIHPVGEEHPIKVDVRIVAATNRNLEHDVERGAFREDLFHRLNVVRIHVPPLRERREDLPVLIRYLLRECAKRENKEIGLSEAALERLVELPWLGNVRQLKNEIERAVALAEPDAVLTPDSFSPELWERSFPPDRRSGANLIPARLAERRMTGEFPMPGRTMAEAVEDLERRMLRDSLERHKGNVTHAAKELGLTRQGLILKRKRYGLEKTK